MLICFKTQYVYLHEALADALLMIMPHVQTDQFPLVVRHMLGKDKTSAKTRVEEQFQVNNIVLIITFLRVYVDKHVGVYL